MQDPNNRPGGPNLILTAKSADKIQFFDAGTLALTAEITMPGSTHEMVRSLDAGKVYASVYGGGIFGKNKDPDRRVAVIDLEARKLERTIDVGGNVAPHSLMMDEGGTLWCTAELGNAVLAIEPESGAVARIPVGGAPHWLAVSHATGKLFASFKTREAVAVLDLERRKVIDIITIPHGAEGLAVSPDGWALFVCAHAQGVVHAFDTRTHALHRTVRIDGAPGTAKQLRRVRVSPDGRYLCVSSHVDNYAAVYDAFSFEQIAGFPTPKAPMGFGFPANGDNAYLCCHDAATVIEFTLRRGRLTGEFNTAAGAEFIISY
jgi:DNA-binding beta-propeller fold protein YncE